MIEELSISGLGVIDTATIPLGSGLTALTGETGAGKTMVVTALGLLLGERADSGAVRSGSGGASVTGRWLLKTGSQIARRLEDSDHSFEKFEDSIELILSRSVSGEGRSKASVGARPVPSGALAELGDELVVVHGQAEQQRLRSATAQRETLDRFGGVELISVLGEYSQKYSAWQEAASRLAELESTLEARAREAQYIREDLADIERIDPKPREDEDLSLEASRLSNVEHLRLAASEAHEAISGGDSAGVASSLASVAKELGKLGNLDSALAGISDAASELGFQASELAGRLATYLSDLEGSSEFNLDQIQTRISELRGLSRRFGSLDAAIELRETASARLSEIEADDDTIAELRNQVSREESVVRDLAARLTALRKAAAERLSAQVSEELHALAMPSANLVVEVSADEKLTASGTDTVALLLAPHPGAPLRPIARSASGGELSRIMLAIEVVLAGTSEVPTFVFDEVDAGVGGATAIEIGRRLARLAQRAQVIVVTHLAQVAAFASNHLQVAKLSDGSITSSSVTRLEGEDREREIARLLSGLADSDSAREHARELLVNAWQQ